MALGPGSIAFSGLNADGSDTLAFVALETILAGSVIYFRDDEWNGTAFNDANESLFAWTATADVAAGTVVRLDSVGSGTISTSAGTVAFVNSGNRGLSNDNDTVYAYVGSSPTEPAAFLAAVTNAGFSAANGALTGTGLTVG